jgi:hypothetical protein
VGLGDPQAWVWAGPKQRARTNGGSKEREGEIAGTLTPLHLSPASQVHDPDLASVKDKNEGELKKEVKKLQKFRDQVKTW